MKISVEGYKSIGKKRSVSFTGLTILSGANSSGKSSFMQPILLIKQTLEADYDAGSLMLDGPNVKLTDSSEIISKVPTVGRDEFAIAYQDSERETKAYYKFREKRGIHIDGVFHRDNKFPDGIRLHIGLKSDDIDKLLPEDEFGMLKSIFGKGRKANWKVTRNRCFLDVKLQVDGRTSPFDTGFSPANELVSFAKRMIHVPGLRGNPERSYKAASSQSLFPGSFEKYVASIIHQWSTVPRERQRFKDLRSQLKQLGLAASVDAVSINDTRLEIRISRHSGCIPGVDDNVNIADVGFGVSQTLPVLVALLTARRNQVVYIEQPELHLHPRAQYHLGRIIAAAAGRGVNVVIETHSSILIRAVQILVAEKKLDPHLVSLNWFTQDPDTGQTEVSNAELDEYGAFGDWPEDFDDVALTVEQAYLDAVERAMQHEG